MSPRSAFIHQHRVCFFFNTWPNKSSYQHSGTVQADICNEKGTGVDHKSLMADLFCFNSASCNKKKKQFVF